MAGYLCLHLPLQWICKKTTSFLGMDAPISTVKVKFWNNKIVLVNPYVLNSAIQGQKVKVKTLRSTLRSCVCALPKEYAYQNWMSYFTDCPWHSKTICYFKHWLKNCVSYKTIKHLAKFNKKWAFALFSVQMRAMVFQAFASN